MPAKNITTHHPKYDDYSESWERMRDCFDGEDTVKEKGQAYLPMKSGTAALTDTTEKLATYNAYKFRAEFPELVSPTVIGSAGLITDQTPEIRLPQQMEYLLEDCDGTGTPLDSFHKQMVTEILITGRYGILPGPLSDGTFILAGYPTEKIINWDTDERGRVNFVVLDETDDRRDPETNEWSRKERYLELTLEDGKYVAYRWDGQTQDPTPLIALKPNQEPVTAVPFVFVNTMDLKPDPDDVPLYGLAKLALRVYRLDADYTQSLHMTAEPTPYCTGFDNAKDAIQNDEVPKSIGASALWILPKGAVAGFMEFSGPGLSAQAAAITASLERAVMFGAQVLAENSRAVESGDARRMRMRSQQSFLRSLAKTAAAGLERALRNIAVWKGLDPETVIVRPYLDFVDYILEPQALTALIQGWMSGAYSKRTLFENMQRADMIPQERSFEDEQELIDMEGPPPGAGDDVDDDSPDDPGNNKPGGAAAGD